uniref:Transmembrane protein n=1 Tax=Globisporangium ultimum (strain ATCC 200006 / CBS 805.95 / DAOM BR144) TaxID=431595 RepID=K3WUU8_GLOUD
VTYGKLPPLNPDDLKLPPPPPSAADKVRSEDAISLSEVWEEIKAKTKEMILGSSVSGLVSVMRGINLLVAGCMIALAIAQIIESDSAFKVMADALSVIYTIFFALLLVGYELRTQGIDAMLRDSFGFMYSPWGRCLFLSMISIFPFGMVGIYGVLVTLFGFSNAYFNYYVIMKHPSFTRGIPDYVPPDATPAANTTANSVV